jgi:hypothetical protein
VPDDPAGLIAGYTGAYEGALLLGWYGALRRTPKSKPVWTCAVLRHEHASATSARRCAEAELERRRQGQGAVITLLRCKPCDRWLPAVDVVPPGCPVCGVPLERVKLVVAERAPA